MKILYKLGLSDYDIKNMIELCPDLNDITDQNIITNINILTSIKCSEKHTKNILLSNPFYLTRDDDDILSLIKKLNELNISNINLLLDSNPFLLNKNAYEIDDYIKKELKSGKDLEEIIDEFESNPYIIDEN